MADQDGLISEFCALTAAEPGQARHYLEASKWDINTAVNQYFGDDNGNEESDNDDEMEEDTPSHAPPPATTGSSSSAPAKGTTGGSRPNKLVSLSDFRKEEVEESDSEGEERQKDFFAGGEKSGLAIKEPGKGGKDIIQNILSKAKGEAERRQGQAEVAGPSRPRFTGAGQTLGSEDSPSVVVPDATARQPRAPETVHRSLTFWRDGFSIEDGPLMRYDDPPNREILKAIQSGRAPTALMGVQQGQQADVHVFRRLEEDYVPPKKKFQPFHGQGNRLGSPTPEASTTAPAAPPPVAPTPQASQAQAPATPQVNIDSSQPTTSLQIRLGDGTRLVGRFNHTHTVGDIYSFVNSASTTSRTRDYVLQTTFPNKELMDHAQTLKEAGLVNAVVVQKWRLES